MTDRERFEAWYLTHWQGVTLAADEFEKDDRGEYFFADVDESWAAWQASRKQALAEAANEAASWGEDCMGQEIAENIRDLANPEGEQE